MDASVASSFQVNRADWALIATADPAEFLLIGRLDREKSPYAFYLCWAPDDRPATMTCFITIAGRRWPVEITFKTGKDTLGWDTSQARTWDAICRHTALTALAQLRTAAIRAALTGAIVLATAGPDTPADGQHPPRNAAADPVTTAGLQFYPYDAPVPVRGGQPCPPDIPPIGLSATETARTDRLARDWKAGLITAARAASSARIECIPCLASSIWG